MSALDGMRVLDLTQYEAGTSCTQTLAWLGADVVKVEPPTGDGGRQVHGRLIQDSQYFLNYNSNKRSVVINLRSERGVALLLAMVKGFDVFIENYGPGVVEKLGIDYETLREVNPRLVYAQIKGYGLTGPYAPYNSLDAVTQAAAGTYSITGFPDGPPVRPGPTYADSGTGAQMATAIVAAYCQQQRTGQGQRVEMSMQEATLSFMKTTPLAGRVPWGGSVPMARRGNNAGPPSGMYQCLGGGANDYIYMMVHSSEMWDALCIAIDRTDLLGDPRFTNPEARRENAQALHEEISQWTERHEKFDAMHIIAGAGVPCSAIYDTADVFSDQHLHAREFIRTVHHPVEGEITLLGQPFRLSESHVDIAPAPLLGQHTFEVLRDELGMADDELVSLATEGVVQSYE